MSSTLTATLAFAFAAGRLSTLDPCGFALLPAFLTYFLDPSGRSGRSGTTTGTAAGSAARMLAAVRAGAAVAAAFALTFTWPGRRSPPGCGPSPAPSSPRTRAPGQGERSADLR